MSEKKFCGFRIIKRKKKNPGDEYEGFCESDPLTDFISVNNPKENSQELAETIREEVLRAVDLSRDIPDEEIRGLVDERVILHGKSLGLDVDQKQSLSADVFNSLRKLDVLQELVDDETVSEIMINGPDSIYVEQNGRLFLWDKSFSSEEKLEDVIQMIVSMNNRIVNESRPIVDARLENGSRVNIVLKPIAINGPVVTIRRFPDDPFTMEQLIEKQMLSEEVAEFLQKMVECRLNIFVSGGTSSGKTTFLNAMANFIPSKERIITIEDSAELNLKNVENLVRLETRNENTEGKNAVTIRDLIKTSLRMRPDRIIVGEVRGGEALDMITAMLSGHAGSLSTGHADSCADMLKRLETMILMAAEMPIPAIRGQIAAAVEVMVHLRRGKDGKRRLVAVEELVGYENGEFILNPLYKVRGMNGKEAVKWEKVGTLRNTEKLI